MRMSVIPAALLAAAVAGATAQPPTQPTPTPQEIARLVAGLGSEEFEEREAAVKRLEELGPAVVEQLRAAAKSENPEVARRAQDLLRRAERKLADAKSLTPTLVELDMKDRPLDDVLAELSRQAKCEVVLGGVQPEELAARKVSVSTGGKVPFWAAVVNVCDAANTEVSSAGGFLAPGAMPYLGRQRAGVRRADPNQAVVLEARGTNPKRPGAVCGAVLVEAVPFPKNAASLSRGGVLLQAWPEPALKWESTVATKVTAATDAAGNRLVAEPTPSGPGEAVRPLRGGGLNMVLIRNPDGSASYGPDPTSGTPSPGAFKPNHRQAVLQFKADGKTAPATDANELAVSVFAKVRSGLEPICRTTKVEADKAATATGSGGTELSVTYGPGPEGRLVANVRLTYDLGVVQPAGVGDELPVARGGANRTVAGLRVTDADGKPYTLGLSGGSHTLSPDRKRVLLLLKLELHPEKEGYGPPDSVTFWGTQSKSVELPVVLKNVPVGSGK